jgi:hypothetical protein
VYLDVSASGCYPRRWFAFVRAVRIYYGPVGHHLLSAMICFGGDFTLPAQTAATVAALPLFPVTNGERPGAKGGLGNRPERSSLVVGTAITADLRNHIPEVAKRIFFCQAKHNPSQLRAPLKAKPMERREACANDQTPVTNGSIRYGSLTQVLRTAEGMQRILWHPVISPIRQQSSLRRWDAVDRLLCSSR